MFFFFQDLWFVLEIIGKVDNCKFYDKYRAFWEYLEEVRNLVLRDYVSLFVKGDFDYIYFKGLT